MSLIVKLNRFKVLKCKNEKYARLEFRGECRKDNVICFVVVQVLQIANFNFLRKSECIYVALLL